ncbi:AAA family ATPase, partial [Enterococcus faecalis]|uniref:AAA family ATPase n=1 Tax=Enterococcus faecalis TaxID=1351 RepID=UPI003D6B3DEE
MYLKRIEITGFKSFADKSIIEFEDDVTAVVGANGSGKSNITEAVRWVLDEQCAKNLRGVKMNDIIFAGSEGRKPV